MTLILSCLLSVSVWCSFGQKVHYSYSGNHIALFRQIDIGKKSPAILFVYDPALEQIQLESASDIGFDLDAFSNLFTSWGYSVLIPLEKKHTLSAINGGIQWLSKQPGIDPAQIHLMGFTYNAFPCLLAAIDYPQVASVILIKPRVPNYTGKYSLPELVRKIDHMQSPVLMLSTRDDKYWKEKETKALKRIFTQAKIEARYVSYPYDKKWFWNPENYYMDDVYHFLTGNQHYFKP